MTANQVSTGAPSVNRRAQPLVERLIDRQHELRVGVERDASGATLVDAGIDAPGGLQAGRLIAEICLGGLGTVNFVAGDASSPLQVQVAAEHPVIACLGSQYAGWSLSAGEGKGKFSALGSGPVRALARKEPLFDELGYRDRADRTVIVLEVDRRPPAEVIDKICRDSGVDANGLTVVLTPTQSLAGGVQIVSRVVEVALHKVHSLGFPLERIVDAAGSAPVPPPATDFMTAMGRTNDAILFGGFVQLYVAGDDDEARSLAEQLPCTASKDYGKPFAQIFKDVGYDFYKIDPQLFAPAEVVVSCLGSGRSYRSGRRDAALLAASMGWSR